MKNFSEATDIIITDKLLESAHGHRERNPTGNQFLSWCAHFAFLEWERTRPELVPGGALGSGMVKLQTSRSPELKAAFIMAEVSAAERTPAVIFVQALISVPAGEAVQAGMVCRFCRWEWRTFFLAHEDGGVWRIRKTLASRKYNLDEGQRMDSLLPEVKGYLAHFESVTGRRPEHREMPPEWLGDYARKRCGVGEQAGLDLALPALDAYDQTTLDYQGKD